MRTTHLAARLQGVAFRALNRAERRAERGDVPGWVLITLMTAGLVTVLWAVAREQLVNLFRNALSSVTG
ncbi:hypothetical protein KMZ32_10285 [Phycicoccus sp. MAQZ13P-2]|uniref:hypothetical protein n=1 Tax=Phycicoccus mangrovi TaxID=2840470 RepID=UPI001C000431|nr:hypothetical protein [Phycicoccus mangrovi]MBT9255862.1 hypothetical protein [Phycicoccus mangrovi]MBT9274456.1 hypothetical protein [Phycicoccus mangrovi]